MILLLLLIIFIMIAGVSDAGVRRVRAFGPRQDLAVPNLSRTAGRNRFVSIRFGSVFLFFKSSFWFGSARASTRRPIVLLVSVKKTLLRRREPVGNLVNKNTKSGDA